MGSGRWVFLKLGDGASRSVVGAGTSECWGGGESRPRDLLVGIL